MVSVERHGCIVEVIDGDGCSGKSNFVVVVKKLSEGEQCFVLHLWKMWTFCTALGRCGVSNKLVCDAVMMVPSGCLTCMPYRHDSTSVHGVLIQT